MFYAQLARDAIQEWKKTDEWGDTYREYNTFPSANHLTGHILSLMLRRRCGVLALCPADGNLDASNMNYADDVSPDTRTVKFDAGDTIRTLFPSNVRTGTSFDRALGHFTPESGWALATRGVEKLMARVIALGGKVAGGKAVTGLVRDGDGRRTSGVTLSDGSCMSARLVVIASGSWTASTFRELNLSEMCLSTG
jgi:sarcosine oxidase / L-pipecolate oxidase